MYKLQEIDIMRLTDNTVIPRDETNLDYQQYLLWEAAGNKPEPQYTEQELADAALKQRIDNEGVWRDSELAVIARQLQALEEEEAADDGEGPVDLLPGTRQQWLKHRSKVSVWREGTAGFPNETKRPVRPA